MILDIFLIEDMNNDDTLDVIGEFLSVPDLVFLGCTCKRLKVQMQVMIGTRMPQWKKRLEREADALEEEYKQINPYTFSSYQAFWDAAMNEKRARIDLRIQRLNYNVCYTALTKSGAHLLNASHHEIAKTDQGGRVTLTGLHVAAACGDLSLCRLLLARGSDVNANIFISNNDRDLDDEDDPCVSGMQDDSNDSHESTNTHMVMNDDDNHHYHWGFITPLRLAMTLGHEPQVSRYLQGQGGEDGTAVHVVGPEVFASSELPPLSEEDGRHSLWASMDEKEIFYRAVTTSAQGGEECGHSGTLFRVDLRTTLACLNVTDNEEEEEEED